MGYSYQDIETRLRTVEEKIDFTMKAFAVQRVERSPIVGSKRTVTTRSLLDLYRDMKGAGEEAIYKSEVGEIIDAVGEEDLPEQRAGEEVI